MERPVCPVYPFYVLYTVRLMFSGIWRHFSAEDQHPAHAFEGVLEAGHEGHCRDLAYFWAGFTARLPVLTEGTSYHVWFSTDGVVPGC
jgi:hypothetical protein